MVSGMVNIKLIDKAQQSQCGRRAFWETTEIKSRLAQILGKSFSSLQGVCICLKAVFHMANSLYMKVTNCIQNKKIFIFIPVHFIGPASPAKNGPGQFDSREKRNWGAVAHTWRDFCKSVAVDLWLIRFKYPFP